MLYYPSSNILYWCGSSKGFSRRSAGVWLISSHRVLFPHLHSVINGQVELQSPVSAAFLRKSSNPNWMELLMFFKSFSLILLLYYWFTIINVIFDGLELFTDILTETFHIGTIFIYHPYTGRIMSTYTLFISVGPRITV